MSKIEWKPFDYKRKKTTAPAADELVWIYEEWYEQGVTIGFFDGYTFRFWSGSDDCSVTHWAPMHYPDAPAAPTIQEPQP